MTRKLVTFFFAAVVALMCWVAGPRAQTCFFHILGLKPGNGRVKRTKKNDSIIRNIFFLYQRITRHVFAPLHPQPSMEMTLVMLLLVIETAMVFGKPAVEDEGNAYTENTIQKDTSWRKLKEIQTKHLITYGTRYQNLCALLWRSKVLYIYFFAFFTPGSKAFFTSMNVSTGDQRSHSSLSGLNNVINNANCLIYTVQLY